MKVYEEQYSQKFALTERADYISSKISTLQDNLTYFTVPKSGKQSSQKAKLDIEKLATIYDSQELEKIPTEQVKEKNIAARKNSTENFIDFLINIRKDEI